MIPKIIHYIWLGNKPVPKLVEENNKVIGNDWEVKVWTDKDFTFEECKFVKEAKELNLPMYCSDALRFYILKQYGGVYLDCDVKLFKTPDNLLDLPFVWGSENGSAKKPTTGILLSEANSIAVNTLWDYYCDLSLLDNGCYRESLDTERMEEYLKDKNVPIVNSIEEYKKCLNLADYCLLNGNGWQEYKEGIEYSFAEHRHSCLWRGVSVATNSLTVKPIKGDIKIFLCAHKPIPNYIPKDKRYIILDVTGKADNTINDNYHDVIDISKDEFTVKHNVCWGEGCAMRWLYNHPDIIPEYICFGHYRRIFLDCIGFEDKMPTLINARGAIIKLPAYKHTTQKNIMYQDHPEDDTDMFIKSVKEATPEYWESFQELLEDNKQYPCNIFAMKKEDFMEMCEMCFKVLDYFDNLQGYRDNEDVFRKMQKLRHRRHLRFGLIWQVRLQGFWLEWLTELYYRHKYGVDKCLKLEAWIPNAEDYEEHSYYR